MGEKITKSKIIQQYLSDYNKRYYLRELAALLKKPHQSIKPYLKKLVNERILIDHERKNILEYSLNLKDPRIIDYLVIAEKERLLARLRKDIIIRILFEDLQLFFDKNTFVIFGSTVKQTNKDSDIDLLVIGKHNPSKAIEKFEAVYSKEVHHVQIAKINELTDTLAFEIFNKHLILNNTESMVRFFMHLNRFSKVPEKSPGFF